RAYPCGQVVGRPSEAALSVESTLGYLSPCLHGLPELLDAEFALHAVHAVELDVAVADNLEPVSPGIQEVQAAATLDDEGEPLPYHGRPGRRDVVHDEAEVARIVGRLAAR